MEDVKRLVEAACPDVHLESGDVGCDVGEVFSDRKAVWERLMVLGPCTGWISTTGSYQELRHPAAVIPGVSGPVSAELYDGAGASWSLRQEGAGWRLRRLVRRLGSGFVRRHSFLVAGDDGWRIAYEVAWRLGLAGTMRPAAARFVGFEQAGGER